MLFTQQTLIRYYQLFYGAYNNFLMPVKIVMVLLFVPAIQQACCEFLERQLDSSNCLGIKAFADTHNCTELSQSAEKFICQNFVEVIKHEEFLNLSKEDLEGLIKRENIAVSKSEIVHLSRLICDTMVAEGEDTN